ncbi:NAD-dependent epimerase/dehydratase family protein [Sandarakinorhabdus sp.]|uniref:NAD-dependent epimerase/dehydratase family protein n=1 Tax=Sandarakinorhabdus sp. TaxID=1916663 RepID=UPI003F6E5FE9
MTQAAAPAGSDGAMIAITGATGFVGKRVLALAGRPVRALTRRPQPPQADVEWVVGHLHNAPALADLCRGAAAIIHIAGVVNAADEAGFLAGNVTGTANMLAAAEAAGVRRFVHVSSVAAREPALSHYGASKAQGDALVMASGLDWVLVRPPGVYGPGDTEMLEVFRAAAWGLGMAPGGRGGRISLIHVDDLARALLVLATGGPSHQILELDDGMGDAGGYTHAAYNRLIAAALGRRVYTVPIAPGVLAAAARVATAAARLQGKLPKLSCDRARYLAHPDWVARGGNALLADDWAPQIGAASGLAATIAEARARKLL